MGFFDNLFGKEKEVTQEPATNMEEMSAVEMEVADGDSDIKFEDLKGDQTAEEMDAELGEQIKNAENPEEMDLAA